MFGVLIKWGRRVLRLIPGVKLLGRLLKKRRLADGVPVREFDYRKIPPVVDRDSLRQHYRNSVVCAEPDRFVIYRIIGNDLYPRHRKGQSRENLRFILENEPFLEGCEKRFVVNRIADLDEEREILRLLNDAGASFIHIPFLWHEYHDIGWDVDGVPSEFAPCGKEYLKLDENQRGRVLMRLCRHKNNYVMNNNGARNAALRQGKKLAKWVLPWDGNCFVTEEGWEDIRRSVLRSPEIPYFLVPMARITDNTQLLKTGFRPPAEDEPQILFRCDSTLEFDPEYFYGRRPKVEFFWRLGVPGAWDLWNIEPWDLPCPAYAELAGAFGYAGWVARLFSGQAHLENGEEVTTLLSERGMARVQAVTGLIDRLDEQAGAGRDWSRPIFITDRKIVRDIDAREVKDDGLLRQLMRVADEALQRGPYSVVDKTTLPPSKNRHDYWHPAPYYWPNPLRIPGLPYVRRDGVRVPGTVLFEPLSDRYDRTRLQRLFDDTFILSMAYAQSGNVRYAEHAAKLVRCWFLAPATAMTPHLEYAQVRKGHNKNRGSSSGIIEMKDLYYFLDAVRLLWQSGAFDNREQVGLKTWFRNYLDWLGESSQGRRERASLNNHGTYYDLQTSAIAGFLGEDKLVRHILRDSRFRIVQQFSPDGQQPEEMKRTTTAHYCCFNLQGWIHLAELASEYGEDLWSFEAADGGGIRQAMRWLLSHIGKEWPYQQIDEFDAERLYPIYYAGLKYYGETFGVHEGSVAPVEEIKPLFYPHDGIRPFWQFGRDLQVAGLQKPITEGLVNA